MPLYPYKKQFPQIAKDAFIAPGAVIVGDVAIGEGSAVWYNTVIRGDVNKVVIGSFSNIQDGSIVHEDSGRGSGLAEGLPTVVGDYVTVGHGVILHACTVESGCLIGMGAILMDGVEIGRGSVIGAGALLTKGTKIPPFSVVLGAPGKVVRTLSEDSIAERKDQAMHYNRLAREHMDSLKNRTGNDPVRL